MTFRQADPRSSVQVVWAELRAPAIVPLRTFYDQTSTKQLRIFRTTDFPRQKAPVQVLAQTFPPPPSP